MTYKTVKKRIILYYRNFQFFLFKAHTKRFGFNVCDGDLFIIDGFVEFVYLLLFGEKIDGFLCTIC